MNRRNFLTLIMPLVAVVTASGQMRRWPMKQPPATPTGFTVVAEAAGSVTLTWDDVK